jgi:hypothetical protein
MKSDIMGEVDEIYDTIQEGVMSDTIDLEDLIELYSWIGGLIDEKKHGSV